MAFSQPKISQNVCSNCDYLRSLSRSKSERKRKIILRAANAEQLLAIAEVCLNIAKSRFKLTARQKNRMLPHVDFIRRMSRARSEKGARKLIVQKGGGAGLFAAILTPILVELTRNLIKGGTKDNP
jgi:hypothetical protein